MPGSRSLDYPAIAVVGPTASGKSALGKALAERFNGEILACDAFQVYRDMDIGTAKPTRAEQGRVPHHMLDLRDPCDDFSAGDYQRLGRKALQTIRDRGNVPIVVGGTGFYLKALIDGLFEGPARSEELRARMREVVSRRGPESIHRALRRIDPESASRLAAADIERNIRAFEIYLLTGQTMSWWQDQPRNRLMGFRWLKLGIRLPRPDLYARIDRRVEKMVRCGFVEEVKTLAARFSKDCQAFKAIGYRQIVEYLEGRISLEQAIGDTQRESRRYAKRQLTWFRADPETIWLDGTPDPNTLLDQAAGLVAAFLA